MVLVQLKYKYLGINRKKWRKEKGENNCNGSDGVVSESRVEREHCNIKFEKDAIQLGWVWYNNHEQDIQFPVPASTSESSSIFLIQFKLGIY